MLVASVAALSLAASAHAQGGTAPPAGQMEMKPTGVPGKVVGARAESLTATVKAVSVATRTITLAGPDGKPHAYKAGPEVRNLEQLAAGDVVVVQYEQGLVMEFQPPGSAPVTPMAAVSAERADPGQKPGGSMAATIQATVTITAIDMKSRVVVFEGPEGNLYQVKAGPQVALEKAKVGDKFVATYTESVAIAVAPAKKAKKK